MKIEIKRGVCLGGGVDAYPGEVHEVADGFGRQLIARGSAVETDKPAGKPKAAAKPKAEAKPKAAANDKEGAENA